MSKATSDAYALLEEMAAKNYQFSNERNMLRNVVGIHDIDLLTTISTQISVLFTQFATLTSQGATASIKLVTMAHSQFQGTRIEQNKHNLQVIETLTTKQLVAKLLPYWPHKPQEPILWNNRNVLQPLLGYSKQ